ncbi:MAG TPA: tetratricopeptide repeat protein, partial [Anaerolineales bacterium]|nr:tetratricopeptide repeat protein [Anaerolineales bacterium]
IFSGLIEIGRGTQDIRRIAFFDELIPAKNKAEDVGAVVQKLADARLITTDEQAGKDTVAISHEKLIDAWPWLKKLVDENRDVIALQNIILNDSKEWDENKRDKSYLYHGARLAKVRQQLIAKDVHLSGSANEFVGASILRQRWGAWSIAALIMTVTIPAIIVISVFIYDFLVSAKLNQSIADFVSPTSSTQRLHVLAQLYRQKGILSSTNSSLQATELFYGLSTYDQLSMFTDYAISGDPGRQNDLVVVVSHLYITVADVNSTEDNTALLKVMRDSLRTNVHDRTGVELGEEISMWIEGRQQVRNGNYQDALSNYSTAIALNSGNPATLYERAKVYVALKRPTDALKDLDTAIAVAKRSAPNIPLTPTPTGISLSASEIPNSALTDVNEADTRTPPPTLELGLAPTLPSPLLTPQRIETFQSNFTTFIDIINAVRILIESTPELQMAIRSNGQSEYTNLQSAGMIRNYPTITPSSTP